MTLVKLFFTSIFLPFALGNIENFEQDLSNEMQIGLAVTGYKSLKLNCKQTSMKVDLETDSDFTGVIYTRGNFYSREKSCFLDPGFGIGQRKFTLDIPYNNCNTKKERDTFFNILVVQHDKDLIMPGDIAFSLECDLWKNKEFKVDTVLGTDDTNDIKSRIGLLNADPAAVVLRTGPKKLVKSDTNSAVITPEVYKSLKDEL